MKRIRTLAAVVATLAVLPGCMWAPGQHLGKSSLPTDLAGSPADQLDIIPITPKWLAMENAVAATTEVPAELRDYRPGEYRIGAGDVLYITVWDHPELTVPAGPQQQLNAAGRLVQSDGKLFYPYVGTVDAAGMTPAMLRDELSRRLARYIEDPQVDVSVLTYASQRVWVTGATASAGSSVPLTVVPLTLSDAIAQAGLNPTVADLSGVRLTRDGKSWVLNLDDPATQNIYLKANDNLFVPYLDSKEVFVVGEVNQPGAQSFRTASITLSQALGRARGLTQTTANGNAVYVIRGSRDLASLPTRVYQLEARSPQAFGVASQFALQPGDVVFVGAAGITRWNRFVNQLLPFTSILSSSASAKSDLDK